ncbi:purine-cytosine permease family protein [Rathayibacter sp. CAU 1779]
MGTDLGEPDDDTVPEPPRRRTSFVPPRDAPAARPDAPAASDSENSVDDGVPDAPLLRPPAPEAPPAQASGSAEHTDADDGPKSGDDRGDTHDDDEIANALEHEVSLLTASLPIIRPESLFTPVKAPEPPYEPKTAVEREIAEQADQGDTLAAIERLEALIASRRGPEGIAPAAEERTPAAGETAQAGGETAPPAGDTAPAAEGEHDVADKTPTDDTIPRARPSDDPDIDDTIPSTARRSPERAAAVFAAAASAEAVPSGPAVGSNADATAADDGATSADDGEAVANEHVPPIDEGEAPANAGQGVGATGPDRPATAEVPVIADDELDVDVPEDVDDVVSGEFGLVPIATPRVRAGEDVLTIGAPQAMPVFSIEETGIEPTPLEYRAGNASRLFWLWFATGASVVIIGVGAILVAAGLNLVQVLVAAVLGIALSFIPLGLSSLTGVWSGQPTVVVSRATFGVVGNTVPAALILLIRLFWSAALLWLLAVTIADTAVASGWTADRAPVLWSVFAVGIVVCVAIAVFGYALVAVVQAIAAVASSILALAIIVVAWPRSGWNHVFGAPFGEWIVVVEGAVLVFSILGLAWASAGGDLARYQRPGSAGTGTALWTGLGAALPLLVLVLFGAVVSLAVPAQEGGFTADPVRMLVDATPRWFAIPVVAAIAIGLLSALVVSLYSGGFAVQAVGIHLPRWGSVIALGVLVALVGGGLVAAVPDVRSLVLGYPTTLAVPIAAWTGIFLGDFLLRRRRLATDSLLHRGGVYPDWRWWNVGGLVVISIIGLGLMRADATWLRWEGFLYRALGVDPHGTLASSDLGVLIALVLGLGLGLLTGRRAVPAQEAASR